MATTKTKMQLENQINELKSQNNFLENRYKDAMLQVIDLKKKIKDLTRNKRS